MITTSTRLSITTMTVLMPRLPRLRRFVIACNMSPPVRDNINVVKFARTPIILDVKPTVFIQLQTERRVLLACASVINVNARNADSYFPYIMHVNLNHCIVKPHVFDYDAFTHVILEICRDNVRCRSGNSHSCNRDHRKQEAAENWRDSPLITHKSFNQFFHFSPSHEES